MAAAALSSASNSFNTSDFKFLSFNDPILDSKMCVCSLKGVKFAIIHENMDEENIGVELADYNVINIANLTAENVKIIKCAHYIAVGNLITAERDFFCDSKSFYMIGATLKAKKARLKCSKAIVIGSKGLQINALVQLFHAAIKEQDGAKLAGIIGATRMILAKFCVKDGFTNENEVAQLEAFKTRDLILPSEEPYLLKEGDECTTVATTAASAASTAALPPPKDDSKTNASKK